MMHEMTVLVLQLAVIIIFSRLFGYLFERFLKQPRVLGELVSGMVIGPYALGRIHLGFLEQSLFTVAEGAIPVSPMLYGFASVASVVLLFLAGLETDLPTFLKFSVPGSAVGLGGVVGSFLLGSYAGVLFLPDVNSVMDPTALFLGTVSTATSVGITARILSEKRQMSSPEGVTVLAAAVLDDVIGIILLAVVVGIARAHGTGAVDWGSVGSVALRAFGFWIGCTFLGILLAPRLIRRLKALRSMELIGGFAFGFALLLAGLAESAGLAMIIGAYVVGLSLSQTDVAGEIREKMEGLYEFLVPIFFAVMGMMVNFQALGQSLLFGLIFTVAAALGKVVGCAVPAFAVGFNLRGAARIGAGMLPRGEVTLIIAGMGLSAGAIGQDIFGVVVLTMLISSVAAPPLLVATLRGGSGYRKESGAEGRRSSQITLELPGEAVADFLRGRILRAFREEEFFVNRADLTSQIYQIRQDQTLITLVQRGTTLALSYAPEKDQLVRLLVLEEILELKEMLESLQKSQSPGRLGEDLLGGLFE
ncbi:MAG: cation:proton antiporter [Spirochaetaceae bacterium]